jgi:hypothetical protein
MSNTQTHKILTDKPVFLLEITKSGAPVKIDLNGMEVYSDRSRLQEFVVYPLNDKISSGENILDVYIIAPKYLNYSLPKDSFVEVKLRVQDAEGNKFTIGKVNYISSESNPLLGSSEEGRYSFVDNEFVKSTSGSGEIEIGQMRSANLQILYGQKMGGIKLSQTISMQTPFPRWKFLDSTNIIDKDFLSMTTEEITALKETPLIMDLYEANVRIHTGLKNKNVASVIDLFDERLEDMDAAFYHSKGHTKEGFYNFLNEEIKGQVELLDIDYDSNRFFIESNRKVAYVYQPIMFVFKDGSGSSKYPIKFRLENGKWVITR